MIVSPSIPPVHTLPDDILWHLFWINTDMMHQTEEEAIPLFTLLDCSHVCSKWRQLILNSPSLWGDVIDLDWLGHDQEWRSEIMRRTGESLLSVMGRTNRTSSDDSGPAIEIMVTFLEDHWYRTRCLDMTFYDVEEWQNYDGRVRDVLQRPAPALQMFIFTTPAGIGFPRDMFLFRGFAPKLRVFHASRIRFSHKAPWLSNLRDLCLTGPLSIRDLLLALHNMVFLETLHDDSESIVDEDEEAGLHDLPHVLVPSLKVVDFSTTINAIKPYIRLIKHVTPAANCTLSFIVFADERELSDERELDKVVQILPVFSAYCRVDEASEIEMELNNGGHFDLKAKFAERDLSRFKVCITHLMPRHTYYIRRLLAALLRPAFRGIERLCLIMESRAEILPTHHEIVNFIHLFESVRILRTSPGSTKAFMKMGINALASAFPSLSSMELTSSPKQEDMLSIRAFLGSMTATGHPMQTVRLPAICRSHKVATDDFAGLQVVFNE